MKIAICSGPESEEISRRIADNLTEKGHTTVVATGGLHDFFRAIEESDALLVAEGGEVSVEIGMAIIFADYIGKGVMAKGQPKNKALQHLLDDIEVKIIG